MQKKLLFVILISMVTLISAQEIKVVRFGIVPGDNTAELSPRKDLGDNLCALVKVKTNNVSGLKFSNHNQYVGDVSCREGVYYVYIPTITSKLSFVHENYQPGEIDMTVFGYKKNIKSGKTYEAILEAPSLLQSTTGVIFKVTPIVEDSYIVIDNKKLFITNDGIVKYGCSQGSYLYKVEADNYKTEYGSVSVTNTFEPIVINLRPVTVEVNVEAMPSDAQIYIDNVNYGKVGIKQLPLGEHEIRLSAKGYIDHIQHINITSSTVNLPHITLKKNDGKYEIIHPVEVTVICNSVNLYKNNKRLEEWNSTNRTIKIMPGTKCRLSDDHGKGAILEVKANQREPMVVRLVDGNLIDGKNVENIKVLDSKLLMAQQSIQNPHNIENRPVVSGNIGSEGIPNRILVSAGEMSKEIEKFKKHKSIKELSISGQMHSGDFYKLLNEYYLFVKYLDLSDVKVVSYGRAPANEIPELCFINTSIKQIRLPYGITRIGRRSFDGCDVLTKIEIQEGLEIIDEFAFHSCTELTTIELPSTLRAIGTQAFANCKKMASIYINARIPPSIVNGAFSGIAGNAVLYVPKGCESAYKNSEWCKYFIIMSSNK